MPGEIGTRESGIGRFATHADSVLCHYSGAVVDLDKPQWLPDASGNTLTHSGEPLQTDNAKCILRMADLLFTWSGLSALVH